MYNGKFERSKSDMKQTVLRYLPIAFIVLISAIIVLLGYWLCLVSIGAVKAMYEFFTENIDKFTIPSEAFIVLGVVGLLVAFAIVVKKCYFSEWITYYSTYSEEENVEKSVEELNDTEKTDEPKMVRKTESTVSNQSSTKRKRPVQSSQADYDVSLNEVVWTNEEPSNRYGFKF